MIIVSCLPGALEIVGLPRLLGTPSPHPWAPSWVRLPWLHLQAVQAWAGGMGYSCLRVSVAITCGISFPVAGCIIRVMRHPLA